MQAHANRMLGLVIAALLGAISLLSAGCDELGTALYLIEGPPRQKAVCELDERRPTVVLVDDRAGVLPRRSLLRDIGETVDRTILDQRLVEDGNLISSRSALNAARGETRTQMKSIVDIGREVGADVVIYVEVIGFGLTRDGQGVWPYAVFDVKLFDTVSNERLFPAEGGGFRLDTPVGREQETINELSRADRSRLEDLLAARGGFQVARMFFETPADTRVPPPLDP